LIHCFTDELWLSRLAYLADIFGQLINLNVSLQGSGMTPFAISEKTKALKMKLSCTAADCEQKGFQHLPTLQNFIAENEITVHSETINDVKQHCCDLISTFS
jgi:hypothetical protein